MQEVDAILELYKLPLPRDLHIIVLKMAGLLRMGKHSLMWIVYI